VNTPTPTPAPETGCDAVPQTEAELFGSGDVSELAGTTRSSLLYRIRNRDLPEATHRVAGRRVFTREDLKRIHALLATNPLLRGRRKSRD
jgi:hypothetical protein